MNKKQMIVMLAGLMVTLREFNGLPQPASSLYLAMGCDYNGSEAILSVGERMGWLRRTRDTVSLTTAGEKQAAKFATVL